MKRNRIITIVSCLLLIVALFCTLFFDDSIGGRISEVITIATALIGAIALFFFFFRDKDINQASFVVEFGKSFEEKEGCRDIMQKLERYRKGETNVFTKNDYTYIVSYLQWCETLSILVQKNVLNLKTIDNLYSYWFFLITNNEYIQKLELVPEAEFYKGVYILHKIWTKYKRKTNQIILEDNTSLEKVENYDKYSEQKD